MKKYNCPFCSERFYRHDLAKHIDKKHDDELPLDYTAYRMAYDVINNKHGHGNCVVCGKPTKWNEKHQKYNRLCGNPKCAKKIKETYQKRMMRVYNKTHLLNDPEQQEKMLAHRRISGKYKWSDGKMFTYTGSYEKKFMEFLDKIMDFKSSEVVAPGPVLEYEFKGKKLHWITDFLIVPYNLIVEIKDGGNNPNNRQMPIYRSKQIAKEKMITNMGEYSYIRLTDNDFGQFLAIIAELKKDIVEDQVKPLYRIHEDVGLEESNNWFNKNLNTYINEKDIYCNMDKWESKKYNILFISGMSGSGKTTLGVQLSKKYKCELIELDNIFCIIKDDDASIKKVPNSLKEFLSKNRNINLKKSINEWIDSRGEDKEKRNKMESEIISYIKYLAGKKERYVVEGIENSWIITKGEFEQYPIIFKGTSKFVSMFRGMIRDGIDINHLIRYILWHLKIYNKMEAEQNNLRNRVITDKNNYQESADDDLDYMDTLMEAVASKIYAIYKLAKKDFDENLTPYIKNKEYRVKDLEGSIISDTEKNRQIIGVYLILPGLVNKDMIGRFKEDMFNLLKDSSSPTGNKSYGKGVKLVDKEDPTQGCYLYAIPKGE